MGKARVGGGCEGDGAERRRVGRLIRNLRVYSQRFVERDGLEAGAISIKVHEGRVVRVSHTYTTHFPVLAARGGNCCVSPEAHDAARPRSRRANLTPEELKELEDTGCPTCGCCSKATCASSVSSNEVRYRRANAAHRAMRRR